MVLGHEDFSHRSQPCSPADDQARDQPPTGRRGFVARPTGDYLYYKRFIETAVRTNAEPSPELIENNRRLASWEAYLGVAEVSSFPVRVYAAITDLCNARCTFCSYATENATGRRIELADIERADWLKFVERFDPNSALGEPLVHPDIAGILEAVRRQAPFIKLGITTNASLLNERVIRAVVGHLSVMTVSLNAARKETYEEVMQPLSWDRTLGNLRRLAEEKRRAGARLPQVHASVVVHRNVLDELPEFPRVLRSVGIDTMRVLVMSTPPPIASRPLYTQADQIHHEPARANQALRDLQAEADRHGVRVLHPPPVLAEHPTGHETAGEESAATDVSREFLDDVAQGREPFCPRPWRTLKVTMTGQTKICCDFFTRLPDFDWPAAKDFHRPDGMWNHSFMQHLRRTMGMPDEVPYCTLCLTKDKRSPAHSEQRADARRTSVAIYRTFEEAALAECYHGSLGTHDRLPEFVLPVENGKGLRPFARDAGHYRRFIRSRHLLQRGRVLQVGASAPAMSAFLAEGNDHLTISDQNQRELGQARDVCTSFDLESHPVRADPHATLPFGDDEFDAAFVEGPTLHRTDRGRLLAEVGRVVRAGGTVHLHRAPAAGALLQRATQAKGDELEQILAVLAAGTAHDGIFNFVTGNDLRRIAQRCGLRLDVSTRASQHWLPPAIENSLRHESAEPELQRLAARWAVSATAGGPPVLEQAVTFSTIVAPHPPNPSGAPSDVATSSAVTIGMPHRRADP